MNSLKLVRRQILLCMVMIALLTLVIQIRPAYANHHSCEPLAGTCWADCWEDDGEGGRNSWMEYYPCNLNCNCITSTKTFYCALCGTPFFISACWQVGDCD
jgi:hypothetical protein